MKNVADNKKYYWIKLQTDFFQTNGAMDYLLTLPNGAEYVVLYLKLCLATANTKGKLGFQIGEALIPYEVEKIAEDMKFKVDTVRIALELFMKFGLIYEEGSGLLAITGYEQMVGHETKWAKYKRDERIGQSLDNVQQSIEYRDKSIENRDKKKSKSKTTDMEVLKELLSQKSISNELSEVVTEWINYKNERKEPYQPTGLKSLLSQIEKAERDYGTTAVCGVITRTMGANYKGIVWDWLKGQQSKQSSEIEGWFNS